ncbi:histidine kinase [Sphaerisporangium rufum]|uniref:Histidine kinase n=1 Tax=Sphaerisporangium rufum TaxID=1381558 RepID=A0A919R8G3_9ACTN|nr:DUF72 domain-containing protein [Sphaerisporangium rufum]GII81143.1 histidine kinase [Sphaerisporangium rufum]
MLIVGTSGWQYADWRGVLYPPGLPQRRWLERYAECFATVENNNAFYRLPARETFEAWRDRTPERFVMAVKASRFLTHIKRLREPAEPVDRLMTAAAGLGDRLGPVLLQLPPTLRAEPARLAECLSRFPAGTRVAVEPRHPSWWTDEVREVLSTQGAALCWADARGRPVTPLWVTAGWGYLRLHQGLASPWPSYGDAALRSWLRRLAGAYPPEADVYVYFNNDPGGAAVRDAGRLGTLAGRAGRPATRTPAGLPGGR